MKGQPAAIHALRYLLGTYDAPGEFREKTGPNEAGLPGDADFHIPAAQTQSKVLLLQGTQSPRPCDPGLHTPSSWPLAQCQSVTKRASFGRARGRRAEASPDPVAGLAPMDILSEPFLHLVPRGPGHSLPAPHTGDLCFARDMRPSGRPFTQYLLLSSRPPKGGEQESSPPPPPFQR